MYAGLTHTAPATFFARSSRTEGYIQRMRSFGNLTFLKNYAYPQTTVDADFAVGSKTGTWTVTRSSTTPATYVDSSGVIQIKTNQTPRFTSGFYDSTGFVSRPGLIVEGAGTNLLKDSYFADGTTTYWRVQGSSTITTSTERTSPFGFASKVMKVSAAATFEGVRTAVASQVALTSGTKYTVSAYVRGTTTATGVYLSVDFTGTGTDVNQSFSISDSNWQFIQKTFTADASENVNIAVSQNGTGTSTIYVAGLQLEALPFASSFIPTTTTALTRNAETLTYPISGNRTKTNETVFTKFTPFWTGTDITTAYRLHETVTKRRVINFQTTDHAKMFYDADGSATTLTEGTTVPQKYTSYVIAGVFSGSSPYTTLYVDGTSEGTPDTTHAPSDPAWGATFYVGSDASSGNQLHGIISSLAIFSDAKSTANVASISSLMSAS